MKTRRKVLITAFVDKSLSDEKFRKYVLKCLEEGSWPDEGIANYKTKAKIVLVGSKFIPPHKKKRDFTFTKTYMGTANERNGMSRQRNRRK